MNFGLQNIVAFFLVLATVVIGAYFLFFRQQGQYIPETWGELGCIHPIYIEKEDLQPKLQRGTFLFLNQCVSSKGIYNWIRGNIGAYRAFKLNGLKISPLFIVRKPLYKLSQFIIR